MRRFLTVIGFSTMILGVAAFRCPGPTPQGMAEPGEGGGGGLGPGSGGRGEGGGVQNCAPRPDEDFDGDGYTEQDGDCDDCDPDVHPGAAELPTRPGEAAVDENCNNELDEHLACEPAGVATTFMAEHAAHAMELCSTRQDRDWGLINAEFKRANGDVWVPVSGDYQQRALAKQFGDKLFPQVGGLMVVLSTGHAFDGTSQNFCDATGCGVDTTKLTPNTPAFPATLSGCMTPEFIYDDIALEVTVRPPPNAGGFAFNTAYLTREYPQSICSPFVDQFLALRLPKPAGWATSNMVYDDNFMPPSVSFLPFPHCDPLKEDDWANLCTLEPAFCPEPPTDYCTQGAGLLAGTGFEPNNILGGATTGWLETTVPLTDDGDFKIRFTIYDTGNVERDSTVLLDGFTWLGSVDTPVPRTEVQ